MNVFVRKAGLADEIIVDNGVIRVGLIPQYGGRIMELSRDGCNVLYRNTGLLERGAGEEETTSTVDWQNYGGYKAWLAPQSKWAWPPIYELDMGAFNYDISEMEDGVSILMESMVAREYGIQMTRTVELSKCSCCMKVKDTVTNMNAHEVEWGIWGNMQVATPGFAELKMYSNKYIGGLQLYQLFDFPQPGAVIRKSESDIVSVMLGKEYGRFKLGTLTDETRLLYCCSKGKTNVQLVISFGFGGDVGYANNCNVEIYNDGESEYAELEVLGRICSIPQGGAINLEQQWILSMTKEGFV